MTDDSISGILETLSRCAKISQSAGGIGLSIHNIRATGSYIKGTGGTSNGIIPMLKVYNDTARYVDQGGGKRKGAFAAYLEPWHADVFEFLDLKKNHGKEELRARDLFYAMWIPDLFMERVREDGEWSLFCPNEAPGLFDCYGGEFEALYHQYEQEGRARKTVRAQELWFAILESQIETGTPYILYKDAANRKSNQKNLGTIRSSNLCTEIMEYTSPDEVAVCNLASIALPKFVDEETREFDFERLFEISRVVTRNLNKVIDINYYPIPEARNSNMRHRPIGIGDHERPFIFIQWSAHDRRAAIRKNAHRTDLSGGIVVARDDNDRCIGCCPHRCEELREPGDRALGRVCPVKNVAGDDHGVGTLIIDHCEDLDEDVLVVIIQGQAMELSAQMPVAGVQNAH